jgi:hypothetical protein
MGICGYLNPTGAIKKPVLGVSGRFRSWWALARGGSSPFARNCFAGKDLRQLLPPDFMPQKDSTVNISSHF